MEENYAIPVRISPKMRDEIDDLIVYIRKEPTHVSWSAFSRSHAMRFLLTKGIESYKAELKRRAREERRRARWAKIEEQDALT